MAQTVGAKLHNTMDANEWAAEFSRLFLEDKHGKDCQCGEDSRGYIDMDLMRVWFANAIMCGWDHAKTEKEKD